MYVDNIIKYVDAKSKTWEKTYIKGKRKLKD